jgi:hypothetical protein
MTNREKFIFEKLNEHYEEAKTLGYEIFAIIVQGSQNYGLDIYTDEYKSDIDTKCIIIPTFEDIVKNKQPKSYTHERANTEHIDIKDIRLMFDTFRKQNVNFVEVLFSDYYIVPNKYKKYWEELRSIAEDIVHAHPSQTVKTMAGMSMEKYKALKHPYPTIKWKIDRWGYDGKQLHHIIRINDFMRQYINGTPFKKCLFPSSNHTIDMMMKAKLNEYSLEEAEVLAKKFDNDTNELKKAFIEKQGENIITDEPYKQLDDIKYRVLKQNFREELLSKEV